MAKNKITEVEKPLVNSFEEVDTALGVISTLTAKVQKVVADYNRKEQKRRDEMHKTIEPDQLEIGKWEKAIEAFCKTQVHKFTDKRTLKLQNGSVSFKDGKPAVILLENFTWESVLKKVQESKIFRKLFVREVPALNKVAILQAAAIPEGKKGHIGNDKLAEIGVKVDCDKNIFSYKVDVPAEVKS